MPEPTPDDGLTRAAVSDVCAALRIPEAPVTQALVQEVLQRFRRAATDELLVKISQLDQTVTQQTHMIEQLHQLIDMVIVQRREAPPPT